MATPLDLLPVPPLGPDFPLPLDRPWSCGQARDVGITDAALRRLVERGQVRRVLRGVAASAALPDTYETRLHALRLVAPPGSVVVDSTAAWLLLGDDALGSGEHVSLPPLRVFDSRPHQRSRQRPLSTGARAFRAGDLIDLDGLRVTTPLRTACDVARLERPPRALALLDCLARAYALTPEDVGDELRRFRGARYVIRARQLAEWLDPGSGSTRESELRMVWLLAGLPRPQLQVEVPRPDGTGRWWFLDIGLPDDRFGAEYDGMVWHGPERSDHDRHRRDVLRKACGWWVEVVDDTRLHSRRPALGDELIAAYRRCRAGERQVIDLAGVRK